MNRTKRKKRLAKAIKRRGKEIDNIKKEIDNMKVTAAWRRLFVQAGILKNE